MVDGVSPPDILLSHSFFGNGRASGLGVCVSSFDSRSSTGHCGVTRKGRERAGAASARGMAMVESILPAHQSVSSLWSDVGMRTATRKYASRLSRPTLAPPDSRVAEPRRLSIHIARRLSLTRKKKHMQHLVTDLSCPVRSDGLSLPIFPFCPYSLSPSLQRSS